MSVLSVLLENVNLNVDETKTWIAPDIEVNGGGQIISIVTGTNPDGDNAALQNLVDTEVILDESQVLFDAVDIVITADETALETLNATIVDLNATYTTLNSGISTYMDEISISTTGSQKIVNMNSDDVKVQLIKDNDDGEAFFKAEVETLFYSTSLDAGSYFVNLNFGLQYWSGGDYVEPTNAEKTQIITVIESVVDNIESNVYTGFNTGTAYNGRALFVNCPYFLVLTETSTINIKVFVSSGGGTENIAYTVNNVSSMMFPSITAGQFNNSIVNIVKIG